jgi:UDP-N-acetylmuramate--alanine ligase
MVSGSRIPVVNAPPPPPPVPVKVIPEPLTTNSYVTVVCGIAPQRRRWRSCVPHIRAAAMIDSPVFFSGIGGSGMLPLASIVRAGGARVAGSDRSLDAGRTPQKFEYLRSLGIQLFPQDGSGLQEGMTLVTSAAVEATVPDVVRARELALAHLTRPQFLAELLNAAQRSVAVGGTSGKSTVTGMIGWILHACHRQPTVMNGAVMKNFVTAAAPFASALVGDPELFVSEVDESDGSISLYRPEIAVLTNISLDHKEMEELRSLFAAFLLRARKAVVNLDDPETRAIADVVPAGQCVGYGFDSPGANFMGKDLQLKAEGAGFAVEAEDERYEVQLQVPGRHNASNALAAIAAARALGVPIADAAAALGRFEGLRRRLETVGQAGGVTVIDDFAHNPDKIAATLATVRAHPGRLLIMFQPHGYGPLTKMGEELAEAFAAGMAADDRLYLPDPVYQGGTVERKRGSNWLADRLAQRDRTATHIPDRAQIGDALVAEARSGDRILIMGARDDTLIDFAQSIVDRLAARN